MSTYQQPGVAPLNPPVSLAQCHVSFSGLMWSEWLKLSSMTSTWVLVGISFAFTLYTAATSALAGIFIFDMLNTNMGTDYSVQNLSATMIGAPIYPGVLMALLGVLSITNEYSSGMIRTTLSITPARWPALGAKALIVAGSPSCPQWWRNSSGRCCRGRS